MLQVREDHNYGEPGPSTLRHSRRTNQTVRPHRSPVEPAVSNSENLVDPLRIPESISGRLRNRTPRSNPSNVDNASDTDDDKPLNLFATESPIRQRPSRQSTRYSDEHVSQSPAGSSAAPSSTRSARTQKRPYYNEDSDEEETQQRKRPATQGR